MNDDIASQLDLNEEGKEQLKKIVLARLNVMPTDVSVTIGSENLTKEQLVKHVQSEDEVGKQMLTKKRVPTFHVKQVRTSRILVILSAN